MGKSPEKSEAGKEAGEGDQPVSSACFICGKKATRILFSSVGHWKLCQRVSCYKELTDRYSEGETTWMERVLPK